MAEISRRRIVMGGLAGLTGLGVGAAGCSTKASAPTTPNGPTPNGPTPSPTKTPTPTPTAASASVDRRPRWPLTGVLLTSTAQAKHAAVAVKVPDNREEHPQRGIDQADIVFVELEGYRDGNGYSSTRLVPVFHSSMPAAVEPVRSIRPIDVPLLSPMDALIGNTGGQVWVRAYAKHYRAHLEGLLSYLNTEGTGAYGTDQSRVYRIGGQAYYDRATVCHPKILAKQTSRFRSGPQQSYFPWASNTAEVSTTQGKPGRTLNIPYKGDGYFMSYRYDTSSKAYERSMPWGPHLAANGKRVAPDNIMVIKAHQHFGKIYRGHGGDEPIQDIVDKSGTFFYFNRDRYVTGTWTKHKVENPFGFALPNGKPFKMAAGQTYVELPDSNAKLRIGG